MKVAFLTYTDELSGASIAANRLHLALKASGLGSRFFVVRKKSGDSGTESIAGSRGRRANSIRRLMSRTIFRLAGASEFETLSANIFPTGLHKRLDDVGADVIHLHWIGAESIRIEEIAHLGTPVVWTLHDEWFHEGIDHYRQTAVSGSGFNGVFSRVRRVLDNSVRSRKAAAWKRLDPFIVTPSHWLAKNTLKSGLVNAERVRVIPNPVPLDIYRPACRAEAREKLGLSPLHEVIGFGAVRADMDPRKGYSFLLEALRLVAARNDAPKTLLVFGAHRGSHALPLPAHFSGTIITDSDLARHYAAMDVFVCPSLHENFPNTIGEAMSCGIPCVAFGVGGIPEMISHGVNGYLAAPGDAADLARGIEACLSSGKSLGLRARDFAEANLAPSLCAARYAEVYEEAVLHARSGPDSARHDD